MRLFSFECIQHVKLTSIRQFHFDCCAHRVVLVFVCPDSYRPSHQRIYFYESSSEPLGSNGSLASFGLKSGSTLWVMLDRIGMIYQQAIVAHVSTHSQHCLNVFAYFQHREHCFDRLACREKALSRYPVSLNSIVHLQFSSIRLVVASFCPTAAISAFLPSVALI